MLFLRAAIAISVLCTIGIGTAPAAERGRERVLIGVSSKSIGFFDPWVAHEKGFFRKYGIESEVITIRPNLSVIALHAGEIDYSWMTGTVIRAAARGIPLKLVTIGLKSSFHTLVARPNFSRSPIFAARRSRSRISAPPTTW
jgi:ABC-type nitrate/sulfonate/bicarbonate transport system substrate-binding protein